MLELPFFQRKFWWRGKRAGLPCQLKHLDTGRRVCKKSRPFVGSYPFNSCCYRDLLIFSMGMPWEYFETIEYFTTSGRFWRYCDVDYTYISMKTIDVISYISPSCPIYTSCNLGTMYAALTSYTWYYSTQSHGFVYGY